MPDGTDMLMLPVSENMIPYTALLDGSVDLVDIIRMGDAVAVRAENARRLSSRE
jgi:uncharacterized protein DUF6889